MSGFFLQLRGDTGRSRSPGSPRPPALGRSPPPTRSSPRAELVSPDRRLQRRPARRSRCTSTARSADAFFVPNRRRAGRWRSAAGSSGATRWTSSPAGRRCPHLRRGAGRRAIGQLAGPGRCRSMPPRGPRDQPDPVRGLPRGDQPLGRRGIYAELIRNRDLKEGAGSARSPARRSDRGARATIGLARRPLDRPTR